MPEPRTHDAIRAGNARRGGPFGWRRRQFVVDARYQLRSGVLVGTVAVVLLVLLNASLVLQDRSQDGTKAALPPLLAGQDLASWALLLLGSAVFLGGVMLVGVLEAHRTAGAAYAIRRAVEAIREGRSDARVRLRRGDHLQDLARSINQLAETIEAERLRRG